MDAFRHLHEKITFKLNAARTNDKKYKRKCQLIWPAEVIELMELQDGRCFYCDKVMVTNNHGITNPRGFTCDRIDNAIGHSRNNIVISCVTCNVGRMNDKYLSSYELIPIDHIHERQRVNDEWKANYFNKNKHTSTSGKSQVNA